MTHGGYKYVKGNYFKDGEETVNLMRRNALGNLETEVNVGRKEKPKVRIRATGAIEPANRPYELFNAKENYYKDKLAVISIGIGPHQGGTWPGSAIYSGAHIEGIGRFMYENDEGNLDTSENISRKARACKRSAIRALGARFKEEPYPFDEVKKELGEFEFPMNKETERELGIVYESRKSKR
jgi:hypothetical protein